MGPNCNSDPDGSFSHFCICSCSSEYCSTMPCHCVSLHYSLKFSCPHHIFMFLTHLAILRALSGSETLHIFGQPSVNAQALTLESSLDAVGMDVSNSGCVSQKGSRQMQREEHANKFWKAAGCQMRACRAWCFKKYWNLELYSNFLCFEGFLKLWWHWRHSDDELERSIACMQSSISENFETWIIFFWENFSCQLCFKRISEAACPSNFSLFQLIK